MKALWRASVQVDKYMTIRFNQLLSGDLLHSWCLWNFEVFWRSTRRQANFTSTLGPAGLHLTLLMLFAIEALNPRTPSNANSLLWYPCEKHETLTPILPAILKKSFGPILSLKQKTRSIVRIAKEVVCQPRRNLDTWSAFMDFRVKRKKPWKSGMKKWLVNHLKLIWRLSKWLWKHLWAVDSNVAQLWLFLNSPIAEGPAPEGAVTFEDVAFTVERAAGEAWSEGRNENEPRLAVPSCLRRWP